MQRWAVILVPIVISSILGSFIWASTSIFELKERLEVQEAMLEGQQEQLSVQQAQIATFQNFLADIRRDVAVVRTIVEERTK